MKKTSGFYVRIFVDMDLFPFLLQQLLMERPCFGFVVVVGDEHLPPFLSFRKIIGHMLSACRQCPQL